MSKKDQKNIIVDAKDKSYGRLACLLAKILMGKDKPSFSTHKDEDRKIEVINLNLVKFTGKKLMNKKYYRHSGYPGALKEVSFSEIFHKNPAVTLKKTVTNMLPDNKLRKNRLKRLIIN